MYDNKGGARYAGMTQNASAFCHPEGVFTPLPQAKNVKTTVRIQFIYVSAPPTTLSSYRGRAVSSWYAVSTCVIKQNNASFAERKTGSRPAPGWRHGGIFPSIGGGDHGVVGRVKIDSCKNCKGARTLHWPLILPVARKPRFFCNTFFQKNTKIFWRISGVFWFSISPRNSRKKTLVFLWCTWIKNKKSRNFWERTGENHEKIALFRFVKICRCSDCLHIYIKCRARGHNHHKFSYRVWQNGTKRHTNTNGPRSNHDE